MKCDFVGQINGSYDYHVVFVNGYLKVGVFQSSSESRYHY